MISVAICDDEAKDLAFIADVIQEYASLHQLTMQIDRFATAQAFVQSNQLYDCYILDVVLENHLSGIDITKQIRTKNPDANIIIVSANIVYAKDAVNIHADYYILKPLEKLELYHALDAILSQYDELTVTVYDLGNMQRKLLLNNIVSIETVKRNTMVSMTNKNQIPIKLSISKWEEMLNQELFVKCYKGLIVNIKQIQQIKDKEITMKDGRVLFASRVCISNVKKRFYHYLDEVTLC